MNAQPAERLPGAVTALRRAVNALCAPQTRYQGGRYQVAPPLYVQLRDTLGGLQNAGYNGAHQSQSPIWLDAQMLLDEIDTASILWHPQLAGVPPTVGRFLSLAENGVKGKGWTPDHIRVIKQITKACEAWVKQIVQLLDPPDVKHFRNPEGDGFAPCPQCGEETTYREDPSEEKPVRVPVLQWVAETGTTCVVCRAHWEPSMTLFVSQLLGFELPDGVLEGG